MISRDDRSGVGQEHPYGAKLALPGIASFLQHHIHTPPQSAQDSGKSSWSSTDSEASSSSPTLGAFKRIAMTSAASRQPSTEPSIGHALHAYSSSSSTTSGSGSSGAARTHVNYKPRANDSNRISFSVHHRPVIRTSRYLREIDRRNILRRIEQGEKQADLAKEYQVSRAAISNLKQRRTRNLTEQQSMDPLTQTRASVDLNAPHHLIAQCQCGSHFESENPESLSSHSQAASSSLMLSPLQLIGRHETEATKEYLDRVLQVNTTTTEVLFARILDQRTDARIFDISKKRIARLLLEHATSVFQTQDIEIPVPSPASNSKSQAPVPMASSTYLGIEFQKPTCAVAVSCRPQSGATSSPAKGALLQEFQGIEPLSETGLVSFASSTSSSVGSGCHIQLPPVVHESNILVLVDTLSSSSAQGVALAIQAVVRTGSHQKDVCIVAICSHDRALAQVLEVFPHVRVVTAKVFAASGAATTLPPATASPAAQEQRRR